MEFPIRPTACLPGTMVLRKGYLFDEVEEELETWRFCILVMRVFLVCLVEVFCFYRSKWLFGLGFHALLHPPRSVIRATHAALNFTSSHLYVPSIDFECKSE